MDDTFLIASIWILLALLASLISIRLGISLALIEILVGVVAGNVIHLQITDWVNFLASLGSVILTFLAGAEIDPASLKKNLKQSVVIGVLSFLLPCICGILVAYFLLGWDINAAKITGIALSTTSVAVVYAVMVESRLTSTSFGQSILAACFITDLGTVLALGFLFTGFSYKLLIFAGAVIVVCFAGIPLAKWIFARYSGKVSEPEIKFVLLILLFLGFLAQYSGSEAVLPAYIIGLAMAGFFLQYKETLHKMRAIAFVAFTPFYFIKAGSLVSIKALAATLSLIIILLLVKVAAKFVGVLPATRLFKYSGRNGIYTTLLMSTGLTFGTISALYGLTNKYISSSQYSVIVTVVILSAVVPTLIAQKFFFPKNVLQEQSVQGGPNNGNE
ncbi:MAG: cation:proton antiporter [Dehalobacter sp.]|nr:cation:proton antiporter [Dehalobacter sp.]